MMTRIQVLGHPIPQPRARVTVRAGHGHAYVPAHHPVHDWRAAIRNAWPNQQHYPTPVHLAIRLRIPRPQSHLKKDGSVRPAHRDDIPPGDVDNYAKAIADALTEAKAWNDDKQVIGLSVSKAWSDRPGAEITVWDADVSA